VPNIIDVKCHGTLLKKWEELKTYEFNDLKDKTRDVSRLKNAIVNEGFCFPLYLWKGKRYVIDGNGRNLALQALEADGYVIPPLPVVEIEANNLQHAKKLVLLASSTYGNVSTASYDAFVSDISLELDDVNVTVADIDTHVEPLDGELEDIDKAEKERLASEMSERINPYSTQFKTPIYQPTGARPSIEDLYDDAKYKELCGKINASSIAEEHKLFLKLAACRHIKFRYDAIAEFYSHADGDVQRLMEDNALVIIDYGAAIEKGFVDLSRGLLELCPEEDDDDDIS